MDGPGSAVGPLSVHHVDVFTDRPMAGNGLAVVASVGPLAAETMLGIAQELRQFETIFLFDVADDEAVARIFTPEEELGFAGHPVLGAAAVLHTQSRPDVDRHVWTIRVGGRPLRVTTARRGQRHHRGRDGSGSGHVFAATFAWRGTPVCCRPWPAARAAACGPAQPGRQYRPPVPPAPGHHRRPGGQPRRRRRPAVDAARDRSRLRLCARPR